MVFSVKELQPCMVSLHYWKVNWISLCFGWGGGEGHSRAALFLTGCITVSLPGTTLWMSAAPLPSCDIKKYVSWSQIFPEGTESPLVENYSSYGLGTASQILKGSYLCPFSTLPENPASVRRKARETSTYTCAPSLTAWAVSPALRHWTAAPDRGRGTDRKPSIPPHRAKGSRNVRSHRPRRSFQETKGKKLECKGKDGSIERLSNLNLNGTCSLSDVSSLRFSSLLYTRRNMSPAMQDCGEGGSSTQGSDRKGALN